MSVTTAPLVPWKPPEIRHFLPVAPGLAKKYMDLFVNRRSYCVQSEHGDHRYYRPRHPDLLKLARKKAGAIPGVEWNTEEHTDRADEIYAILVKEQNRSNFLGLTEETIAQHLAGQITVNLFAINPDNQCCKWVAIDADYATEPAQRDLARLRGELEKDGIFAVQEDSRRGGHLWIFCEEPLLARKCRIFIYNLALGIGVPIKASGFDQEGIEIFPKQDSIEPGGLGNALRAPLGIHRKNNTRYWLRGNVADETLADQIEALCKLPKMTAKQLDDLTVGMPTPPQWNIPEVLPPTPRKQFVVGFDKKSKPFYILDHVTLRGKRASRFTEFTQCPSCASTGQDRHRDNLEVGKPRTEKDGFYRCHTGRCSTDDIREACGHPRRSPYFKKR
jgi:hypothetical protein